MRKSDFEKTGGSHMADSIMREKMIYVYDALAEKGYDPVQQIVGYILSDDPTYITNHNDARKKIARMDRDALLHEMLEDYFSR